ncbi:hypothetical protein E4U53_001199 [Claviceps sorghi]|nr:hypothetical protein E4U53_001199 [Claviceps sorghi]
MYAGKPSSADSATINPAALNSPGEHLLAFVNERHGKAITESLGNRLRVSSSAVNVPASGCTQSAMIRNVAGLEPIRIEKPVDVLDFPAITCILKWRTRSQFFAFMELLTMVP